MKDDAENTGPFPDLDAAGALRAAFRTRDSTHGHAPRPNVSAPVVAPTERGYELEGEIARGGMGVIVKAFDRGLTRDVALKVLRDEFADEPRFVRRFFEEARVTARLDHPGIVPVHEAGRDAAGRAFFAMRLVRGRDLRRIIELANAGLEGWSQTRALSVFLKVCEAMAYAHDRGVLHRDLKPSNVMVGEFGEVYVMDWGLARVIGGEDAHDLRLREQPSDARTRGAADRANVESPIVTMDGEVLGTPCYMSPEQAQGRVTDLGPSTDVYAVGAMLYHLLAGEMPYVPSGTSVASRTVLMHLVQGPPEPLHEMRADLPGELIAICERAMARDPKQRYSTMLAMAEDLRAYLERRVVRAYETGAWAEAKKWVRRNKALAVVSAAAVLALVGGLVASLVLKAQSDRNARLAGDNAAIAERNEKQAERERERAKENEQLATDRADDVFRLSALQDLDDLSAEANQFWPVQPEMIPHYEAWQARARKAVDELPAHEAKLLELRAKAVPWTPEQAAAARAKHPRLAELETSKRKLAHCRELLLALESQTAGQNPNPPEAVIDFAALPATAQELNNQAWPLVDPKRHDWGGEAKGLLLAQRALELAAALTPIERSLILDTLAWAYFANGRFDDAIAALARAQRETEGDRARLIESHLGELRHAIEGESLAQQRARVAEIEQRVAGLEATVSARAEWSFNDTQDKWWHNQLEKLIDRLRTISDPDRGLLSSTGVSREFGWSVGKRLEFARTVEARSVSGPEAAAKWSEALTSIRDKTVCPLYDGLTLAPQLGLLPIGRDRDSGLWEFAHLLTGEPAERGADGKLILREATGLVFVLLPGGAYQMGAQKTDRGAPNFDPQAEDDEGPVHLVTLKPFFFSKYEMTQGQWLRFTGNNPSQFGPQYYGPTWSRSDRSGLLAHPVEQVSWTACMETLARMDLNLPTEEQWEYGCRGGTSHVFWCGDEQESLRGVANILDSFGNAHGDAGYAVFEEWLDDGETVHGEVGRYRVNAFGLHDVHGNVLEWCRGARNFYTPGQRAGDVAQSPKDDHRAIRGGSFGAFAKASRCAFRGDIARSAAGSNVGLRPIGSVSR